MLHVCYQYVLRRQHQGGVTRFTIGCIPLPARSRVLRAHIALVSPAAMCIYAAVAYLLQV